MKGVAAKLLFAALFALTGNASASDVSWLPPATIVWSGDIDAEGLQEFRAILARQPVAHLELVASVGGTRGVARSAIAEVLGHRLNTSAKGNCMSACALVFLAGRERTMLPSGTEAPTRIGIHGVYHNVTHELVAPTEREVTYVVEATGGRMTKELVQIVLSTQSIRGGLLVFESPLMTAVGPQRVMYCDIQGEASQLACAPLEGADALSLGIVNRLNQ